MVGFKANDEFPRHVFEGVRNTARLPYVVAGGFNESIARNATLASELGASAVVDVAGQTAFAGQHAPLMTCR
eukprot:9278-Alexandrium_andersonii.AAC.1